MIKDIYKTAIVHDLVLAIAGAENTLESIYKVYPSPVYTLLLNRDRIKGSLLSKALFRTSFIQRLPWALKKYRAYLPFYPLAIEQFDLNKYDVVLSSSFVVAKGVVTNTEQLHICYMHNPIRPAWELYQQFLSQTGNSSGIKGLLTRLIFHYLRQWDVISANRVDHFIANSKYTAQRIKKIYNREATVIYPPVNIEAFTLVEEKENYYVTASRLVYHKRIDLIIRAFANTQNRKLVVVGEGPEMEKLKKIATPNVQVLGYQPLDTLVRLVQRAKAFIFAAKEDFGVAPIEAMACGTPVLAYGKGGTLETVIDGQTGLFFYEQTPASIIDGVERIETSTHLFDPAFIRAHAVKFSVDRFEREYQDFTQNKINEFFPGNTRSNRLTEEDLTPLNLEA